MWLFLSTCSNTQQQSSVLKSEGRGISLLSKRSPTELHLSVFEFVCHPHHTTKTTPKKVNKNTLLNWKNCRFSIIDGPLGPQASKLLGLVTVNLGVGYRHRNYRT